MNLKHGELNLPLLLEKLTLYKNYTNRGIKLQGSCRTHSTPVSICQTSNEQLYLVLGKALSAR